MGGSNMVINVKFAHEFYHRAPSDNDLAAQ